MRGCNTEWASFGSLNVAEAVTSPLHTIYERGYITMADMSMNKATFREIVGRYMEKPFFVGMDSGDLEDMFYLGEDILDAERDAVKVSEPYASRTIDRLEAARHEVAQMGWSVGDAFEEAFDR